MNHSHVYLLRNQVRWLDHRIRQEMRRPQPDTWALQDLRRRKLALQDEIFMAENGLEPLRA